MTPTSIMKVSFPSVKMVKNKLEIVPIYGFQNQFSSSLPLITSSCKAVTTCLNSHWKNNFPDGKKKNSTWKNIFSIFPNEKTGKVKKYSVLTFHCLNHLF